MTGQELYDKLGAMTPEQRSAKVEVRKRRGSLTKGIYPNDVKYEPEHVRYTGPDPEGDDDEPSKPKVEIVTGKSKKRPKH